MSKIVQKAVLSVRDNEPVLEQVIVPDAYSIRFLFVELQARLKPQRPGQGFGNCYKLAAMGLKT
ncbi:hypothetical protein SAMN05421753_12832 [Planctomicrobium piriforme]|uniref:Uncharacterized protein n=1 Tax=Planctomicrobium piriforme TaxID=1576369 RepID=A0A1I3T861_9PLAN|nr:hypothetical protein SAMN05421753_12832 [Planctomicrobium piriforme]